MIYYNNTGIKDYTYTEYIYNMSTVFSCSLNYWDQYCRNRSLDQVRKWINMIVSMNLFQGVLGVLNQDSEFYE